MFLDNNRCPPTLPTTHASYLRCRGGDEKSEFIACHPRLHENERAHNGFIIGGDSNKGGNGFIICGDSNKGG